MRVRSRGSLATTNVRYGTGFISWYHTSPPSAWPNPTINTNHSSAFYGNYESMTDSLSPGYFKSTRDGDPLPVNELSHLRISGPEAEPGRIRVSGIQHNDQNRPSRRTLSFSSQPTPSVDAPVPNQIPGLRSGNDLLIEAFANVQQKIMDIGTTLYEAQKAVKMLKGLERRTVRTIDRILDDIKRKRRSRFHSVAELGGEFSSLWLSGRYGWRPLYYDYLSAVEAIDRAQGKLNSIARGYASDSNSKTTYTSWSSQIGGLQRRTKTTVEVQRKAFAGARIRNHQFMQANAYVTAWEAVPYSWVADFFLNIGDAIWAFNPNKEVDILFSGCSEETTTTREYEYRSPPSDPTVTYTIAENTLGSSVVVRKQKTRFQMSPTLRLHFRMKMNPYKWADLGTLIIAAIGRRSKILDQVSRESRQWEYGAQKRRKPR